MDSTRAGARKSFRFSDADDMMMSRTACDVLCIGRSSCIVKCMRIISRSSGVRRTVEAADLLVGLEVVAELVERKCDHPCVDGCQGSYESDRVGHCDL